MCDQLSSQQNLADSCQLGCAICIESACPRVVGHQHPVRGLRLPNTRSVHTCGEYTVCVREDPLNPVEVAVCFVFALICC